MNGKGATWPPAAKGTPSGSGRDRRAAEDRVAVVEDRGLTLRDTAGRGIQPDQEFASGGAGHGGVDFAMRPQLHQAVAGPLGWRASCPHRALGHEVKHVEVLDRADGYRT